MIKRILKLIPIFVWMAGMLTGCSLMSKNFTPDVMPLIVWGGSLIGLEIVDRKWKLFTTFEFIFWGTTGLILIKLIWLRYLG